MSNNFNWSKKYCFLLVLLVLISACGGGGSKSSQPSVPNEPVNSVNAIPTATITGLDSAFINQEITLTIDAQDSDGTIKEVNWVQSMGMGFITVLHSDNTSFTFTMPKEFSDHFIEISAEVVDNLGANTSVSHQVDFIELDVPTLTIEGLSQIESGQTTVLAAQLSHNPNNAFYVEWITLGGPGGIESLAEEMNLTIIAPLVDITHTFEIKALLKFKGAVVSTSSIEMTFKPTEVSTSTVTLSKNSQEYISGETLIFTVSETQNITAKIADEDVDLIPLSGGSYALSIPNLSPTNYTLELNLDDGIATTTFNIVELEPLEKYQDYLTSAKEQALAQVIEMASFSSIETQLQLTEQIENAFTEIESLTVEEQALVASQLSWLKDAQIEQTQNSQVQTAQNRVLSSNKFAQQYSSSSSSNEGACDDLQGDLIIYHSVMAYSIAAGTASAIVVVVAPNPIAAIGLAASVSSIIISGEKIKQTYNQLQECPTSSATITAELTQELDGLYDNIKSGSYLKIKRVSHQKTAPAVLAGKTMILEVIKQSQFDGQISSILASLKGLFNGTIRKILPNSITLFFEQLNAEQFERTLTQSEISIEKITNELVGAELTTIESGDILITFQLTGTQSQSTQVGFIEKSSARTFYLNVQVDPADAPQAFSNTIIAYRSNNAIEIQLAGENANSFEIKVEPERGSITWLNQGTGLLTYTPTDDNYDNDQFTFITTNASGESVHATIIIDYNQVPYLPGAGQIFDSVQPDFIEEKRPNYQTNLWGYTNVTIHWVVKEHDNGIYQAMIDKVTEGDDAKPRNIFVHEVFQSDGFWQSVLIDHKSFYVDNWRPYHLNYHYTYNKKLNGQEQWWSYPTSFVNYKFKIDSYYLYEDKKFESRQNDDGSWQRLTISRDVFDDQDRLTEHTPYVAKQLNGFWHDAIEGDVITYGRISTGSPQQIYPTRRITPHVAKLGTPSDYVTFNSQPKDYFADGRVNPVFTNPFTSVIEGEALYIVSENGEDWIDSRSLYEVVESDSSGDLSGKGHWGGVLTETRSYSNGAASDNTGEGYPDNHIHIWRYDKRFNQYNRWEHFEVEHCQRLNGINWECFNTP